MRIHTGRHLSRRTVLRGMGAALSLPFLDSMVPAFAGAHVAAATPVNRLGIVYVPNGMWMRQWTPSADPVGTGPNAVGAGANAAGAGANAVGAGFSLPISEPLTITPLLESLRPFHDRMILLTGLANGEAD